MNNIPVFKANLIQNLDNNKPASPSVEEILAKPSVEQVSQNQPKSSHSFVKMFGGVALLAAMGVAGRQGCFGKSVQKFLGKTPAPSAEQIQQKIQNKLNEYVARTEDALFELKVLQNGKTKAVRNLANGQQEIVVFNKNSGAPEVRVIMQRNVKEKEFSYTSYKGADVLDEGFDSTAFYKKYASDGIKRKYRFFGEKSNNSVITYGEMVRRKGLTTIERNTIYNQNGNLKRIVEKDNTNPGVTTREILYDAKDKSKAIGVEINTGNSVIRRVKGNPTEIINVQNS